MNLLSHTQSETNTAEANYLINWLIDSILFDTLNNRLCQFPRLINKQLQMQVDDCFGEMPNISTGTSSYHNIAC